VSGVSSWLLLTTRSSKKCSSSARTPNSASSWLTGPSRDGADASVKSRGEPGSLRFTQFTILGRSSYEKVLSPQAQCTAVCKQYNNHCTRSPPTHRAVATRARDLVDVRVSASPKSPRRVQAQLPSERPGEQSCVLAQLTREAITTTSPLSATSSPIHRRIAEEAVSSYHSAS
jgi:hypothetical protein